MDRNDLNDLRRPVRKYETVIRDLEKLFELKEDDGITVSEEKIGEAQLKAQESLDDMQETLDDVSGRSGYFQPIGDAMGIDRDKAEKRDLPGPARGKAKGKNKGG